MGYMRTSILLILISSGIWSCRKDPIAITSDTGTGTCVEFLLPNELEGDTIAVLSGEFYVYQTVYFNVPSNPSIRLSTSGYYVNANQAWPASRATLTGYSNDSIGVFIPPMLVNYTPRSFQVGDTLDPFAQLQSRVDLFFSDALAGVTALDPPPVWYIGFVKIIEGKKHVGYVRVGTSVVPGNRRYWLEHAQLSLCPETPIVITD